MEMRIKHTTVYFKQESNDTHWIGFDIDGHILWTPINSKSFNAILKAIEKNDHHKKDIEDVCRMILERHLNDTDQTASSFAKKIGITPPTLLNFIKGISSITLRTMKKIEQQINQDYEK